MHILLIHGALGDRAQLAPLVPLLGESLGDGYSFHPIELEGHGRTPAAGASYELPRFTSQVREYLSRHSIERAAVFGYSLGGYVGLTLAAESPELVSAVVTLATKLAWTPETAARETSRLHPPTIRAKVPKFAAQLEERHAGAGGWESVLDRTARFITQLGDAPTLGPSVLATINQRVRLMVGDRDALVTADETLAASRSLAGGELAILPNTPHPFEQMRLPLVVAQLRDFFA